MKTQKTPILTERREENTILSEIFCRYELRGQTARKKKHDGVMPERVGGSITIGCCCVSLSHQFTTQENHQTTRNNSFAKKQQFFCTIPFFDVFLIKKLSGRGRRPIELSLFASKKNEQIRIDQFVNVILADVAKKCAANRMEVDRRRFKATYLLSRPFHQHRFFSACTMSGSLSGICFPPCALGSEFELKTAQPRR